MVELCGPHKVGSGTVGSLLTDRPFTVDLNAKLIFGKPEDRLSRFPDDIASLEIL